MARRTGIDLDHYGEHAIKASTYLPTFISVIHNPSYEDVAQNAYAYNCRCFLSLT